MAGLWLSDVDVDVDARVGTASEGEVGVCGRSGIAGGNEDEGVGLRCERELPGRLGT